MKTECLAGNIDMDEVREHNAEQMVVYMDSVHELADHLDHAMNHAACDLALTQHGDFDDRVEENLQNAAEQPMLIAIAKRLLETIR